MLNNNPCDKIGNWDFERGQTVGTPLAETPVTKTATLLGVRRARVISEEM
jgi:hypothetical protein